MAKRFVKEYANYEIERMKSIPGMHKMVLGMREEKISKYVSAYERGLISEREVMGKISEIADEKPVRLLEPDTFYTGGGIWLSAMHINHMGAYVVVDNDWDCLTMYPDAFSDGWDGIDEFPCGSNKDFLWSKEVSELNETELGWYKMLRADLDKNAD